MPPDISCGYCSTRSLGIGDADQVEQLDRTVVRRLLRAAEVPTAHLGDLGADGEQRVERRHRVLEDHRDLLAAHSRSVSSASCTSDSPFQRTSPPVILPGQLDQPEQRLGGDALAGAALADEAERLAAVEWKRHAAHGLHDTAPREEIDVQVLDLEQRRGRRVDGTCALDLAGVESSLTARRPALAWKLDANRFSRSCGSSIDPQPAAQQVDGEHGEAEQQIPDR